MATQIRHMRISKRGKPFVAGSLSEAKKHAKEMGFKTEKADVTPTFYRFRQESPGKFNKFRTVSPKSSSTQLVLGIDTKGTKTRKDDVSHVQSVLVRRK